RIMRMGFLLFGAAALMCTVHSAKVTEDILSCASQIDGRVGGESNAKVKSAIASMLGNMRSGDFAAVQKVVRESDESDRKSVINKYMVDSCGHLKMCMVCPLELA
ncbi:hypothetical protein PMAYCL1PPCAC_14815, partial [Pristionchus mayeri]